MHEINDLQRNQAKLSNAGGNAHSFAVCGGQANVVGMAKYELKLELEGHKYFPENQVDTLAAARIFCLARMGSGWIGKPLRSDPGGGGSGGSRDCRGGLSASRSERG